MARKRVKVPVHRAEETTVEENQNEPQERTVNARASGEAGEEIPSAPVESRSPGDVGGGLAPSEAATEPEAGVTEAEGILPEKPEGMEEERALREELERARTEAETYKDRYLRTAAEMDNMRKRLERRYADEAEQEKMRFLRAILPVIDHLEMVLKHSGSDSDVLRQGVEMTLQEFLRTLEREGVMPVQSVGQPFDPFIHEAVEAVESDQYPPGTVVEEVQRGYTYRGRLLRPARVRVVREPRE